MMYAPVIITTLCRYDHFVACLESLEANYDADNTDVYIGLDYPLKESHWAGYKKIKEYLESRKFKFASLNIIIRKENFGSLRNVFDLLDIVKKKHDRFILSEDDNIFAKTYLAYMNESLEYIMNKEQFFGVCGYSYPIEWKNNENVIMLKSLFPAWGYGMLFKNFDEFMNSYTITFLKKQIQNKKKLNELKSLTKWGYGWYINRAYSSKVSYFDIDMQLYQFFNDKVSIMPRKSLVRNMGWDGSGINCNNVSFNFSSQELLDDNVYVNYIDACDIQKYEKENEKLAWSFVDTIKGRISIEFFIKSFMKYLLLKMNLR